MLLQISVPINQASPGTLEVKAALAGAIHQVTGFMIYMTAAGTWKFSDGADLTGPIGVLKDALPITHVGLVPVAVSRRGYPLNLVTTGGAARGFVIVMTERDGE